MNGSILLPFSGSRESMFAMDLAWTLAERLEMSVDAQHVVNIRGALDVLGVTTPGIIGSGPYVGAFESLCSELRNIATKLEDSYKARKAGRGVSGEWFVDEGEPVDIIVNRSTQHDLLVMGHHQHEQPEQQLLRHQAVRLSLSEILSQTSHAPLLVVQNQFTSISELALILAVDHVNSKWIGNCMQLASALQVNCSLTFLAAGLHEEPPTDFVRDLKDANPALVDLKMRIVTREGHQPAALATHHLRGLLGEPGCLPVIATIDNEERRITSFGESPSDMLRRLAFDALLIWPEESRYPLFPESAGTNDANEPLQLTS
ncbi:MAG: universal stress protein [Candidatus Obscuribacterales bacterium]